MRAFLGVVPEGEARDFLRNSVRILREEIGLEGVRWVREENWHMTLHFFAELPEQVLRDFCEEIGNKLRFWKAFRIVIERPAFFPSEKRPRLIASVSKRDERLIALVEQIHEVIKKFGLPPADKLFCGHITLGRLRENFKFRASEKLLRLSSKCHNKEVEICLMPVTEIFLFASKILSSGPVYSILDSFRLQGSKSKIIIEG
ncbi:MAG: RNA 2',3'-cyclic phosphodiesterase [Chthoniobacterales bacterium]|nr:RNA 2',3'-cyclic phosphodiesterase [Chthoniobacterales bacterium]